MFHDFLISFVEIYNYTMQTTTIQPIEASSIKRIIEIGNKQFGNGFITELELLNIIKTPNKYGLVSITDNEISGFVLASVCNSIEELNPIIISNHNWFANTYISKFPIAVFESIGVCEKHTDLGIGKLLTIAILNITNKVSKTTLSMVWEHQNGKSLSHILDQCGLKMQIKMPNYWHEDSIYNNYDCKYCGTPPCNCSMMVYSD